MTEDVPDGRYLRWLIISSGERTLKAQEVAICRRLAVDLCVHLQKGLVHVSIDELLDSRGKRILSVKRLVGKSSGFTACHTGLMEIENLAAIVNLREDVQELTKGQRTLVNSDLIPACEAWWYRCHISHFNVVPFLLSLSRLFRLEELEGHGGKVDVRRAEVRLAQTKHKLVHFHANSTSDHGSRGGDGRNNAAGNHLHLVARGLINVVVPCTHVRARSDEVDVEVAIIILLKVSRDRNNRLVLGTHLLDLIDEVSLCSRKLVTLHAWTAAAIIFRDVLLRSNPLLQSDVGMGKDIFKLLLVRNLRDLVHEGVKVGTSHHISSVFGIRAVKHSIARETLGAGPEGLHDTSVRILLGRVFREAVLKVANAKVVLLLEFVNSKLDASLE